MVFIYADYRARIFDAVTKEDLSRAYSSALTYFLDSPDGKVTMSDLEKYGFRSSPHVNIRIINGKLSNLLMVSFYDAPGTQAYVTHSREGILPEGYSPIWLASIQGWTGGAGQAAGPPLVNLREGESRVNIQPVQADILQVCNQAAIEELKEAYAAAQNYFQEYPEGTLTKDLLFAYGYTPDENVNAVINSEASSEFSISSFFNIPGAAYYTADDQGRINTTVARR